MQIPLRYAAYITLLTLFGCAGPKVHMYDGPHLSEDQQSIIRAATKADGLAGGSLEILFVDDQKTVTIFDQLITYRSASAVYLIPGPHKLQIKYSDISGNYVIGNILADCEAGITYVAKGEATGYRMRIWLENEKNGQVINQE